MLRIPHCLDNRLIDGGKVVSPTHLHQFCVIYSYIVHSSDPPERIRPCDLQKLLNSLKLKMACGIDGIPNECLRHLPRRPLVHLTHMINHCIQLSHFLRSWKEAKVVALLKPGKDPKLPQNLSRISLLSLTGKVF
jgi:hypothetical protein